LYHSTSANGVANYNDDQCDDLYGVFQHYVFNLTEFRGASSPLFLPTERTDFQLAA